MGNGTHNVTLPHIRIPRDMFGKYLTTFNISGTIRTDFMEIDSQSEKPLLILADTHIWYCSILTSDFYYHLMKMVVETLGL